MASQSAKENVPPVETIRCGGVAASIFANDVKDLPIPLYKVSINRTYKAKDGKFKTVMSFRHEDQPYVEYVNRKAWVKIAELKSQAWEDSRKESDTATIEEVFED